jgi:hypothetical protein
VPVLQPRLCEINRPILMKLFISYYYPLLLLFIPLSLSMEHRASTVPRHLRILFQFLGSIRQLVGLLGGGISPAQGLYLQRTTQHRKTQTSMPRAGIETAISILERPKTVLDLDRSAIQTVLFISYTTYKILSNLYNYVY